MNDLDNATPFSVEERQRITEIATRFQHQRGTQGVWARRWLRLAHMLTAAEVDRDNAQYDTMERPGCDA